MPQINVNGVELYYEEYGSGTETVVFAHGLLMDCRMFERQVETLRKNYRCVAFDFRGQGQSQITEDGYDMDTLTKDTSALINELNCAPCHFAGLSMGGFV
jgi:pimeloyl-ACP methyl ester carboxylesterase